MSSPLKTRQAITKSSSTTSQLETSSAEDNTYCSPIHTSSYPYTQQLSCQMASNTGANEGQFVKGKSSVTDLMTKSARQQTVDTDMPVKHAVAQPMENIIATLPPRIELAGKRPKYLRYHIWDPDGAVAEMMAEWTERAKPLPRPSSEQLMHPLTRDH
jgi:hypothetical protein